MDIDTNNEHLRGIFQMFGEELVAIISKIEKETNMEDEQLALIVSDGIVGSLDSSVRALNVYKQNEFTDTEISMNREKLEQSRRMTPFMLDGARIDNNTKEQKYITEQLRNGGIKFEYTFYRSWIDDVGNKIETQLIDEDTITVPVEQTTINKDGITTTETINKEYILFRDYKRVASKTIVPGTSLSTVELNNLKIIADTEYVNTQKTELSASVIYNNKLKVFDSLSDLWGTLGAGGLVVPEAGWSPIFNIAKDLANVTLPTNIASFQNAIKKVD